MSRTTLKSTTSKKDEIILQRFLSKVDRTDSCWIWFGATQYSGYGRFWNGTKVTGAHQFSYKTYRGNIDKGFVVMHSCDNPSCVNPDHLNVGTVKDNLQDMHKKKRNRKLDTYTSGANHHGAKLTKDQVIEARLLYKQGGETWISLANKYNVSKRCMGGVLKNQTYKYE